MADFIRYTPTASLSGEERTVTNYFNAIREWVESSDAINKYFNISVDRSSSNTENWILLIPKNDNIKNFPLKLLMTSSGSFALQCCCECNNTTGDYSWTNSAYSVTNTNSCRMDIMLDVFCDEYTFIIRNASYNNDNYFMITTATNIDDNSKCPVCVYMYASNMYIGYTGSASIAIRDNYYSAMHSQFNFLLRPYGIYSTPLLFDKVYAMDAGNSWPGVGKIKINNKYYYKLLYNILFKMD